MGERAHIVKHCTKYSKNNEQYGQRWVERALAFLRAQRVVSRRLKRFRNNRWLEGYIVTGHTELTRREKTHCDFVGWAAASPGQHGRRCRRISFGLFTKIISRYAGRGAGRYQKRRRPV